MVSAIFPPLSARRCDGPPSIFRWPEGRPTSKSTSVLLNLYIYLQARVSLARAAYSPADIVLLDDPLSAVDSYVGKAILDNCLLNGPLADKTRVLVTHSLHVLDKTDYIYVMENGHITEQGTYNVSFIHYRRSHDTSC